MTDQPIYDDNYVFKTRLEILNYAVDLICKLMNKEGMQIPPELPAQLKFKPEQIIEDLNDASHYYSFSLNMYNKSTGESADEKIVITFSDSAFDFAPLLIVCLYDREGLFRTKKDVDDRVTFINKDQLKKINQGYEPANALTPPTPPTLH